MLTTGPSTPIYYIQECSTRQPVIAHFQPMELADVAEVKSAAWQGVFQAMWKQITATEMLRQRTLKLVCDVASDTRIQALLYLGDGQNGQWSLDCLLEAAPWNQYQYSRRVYCGVGKALVARVIAEHRHRGYRTPIQIEASPRSLRFYQRLGFVHPTQAPRPNRLFLMEDMATTILQSVTAPPV